MTLAENFFGAKLQHQVMIPYSEPRCVTRCRLACVRHRLKWMRLSLTKTMGGNGGQGAEGLIRQIHACEADIDRLTSKLAKNVSPV
jgi:hypothetical protein